MKRILFFNGIIESLAGIVLMIRPDLLFSGKETGAMGLVVIKLYSILALAFGGLSLIISKHGQGENMFRFSALVVIVFHLLIGFQCYGAYAGGLMPNIGAAVVHLVISVIFGGLFLQAKK